MKKSKKMGRPTKKKRDKGTRYCVFVDSMTNDMWKKFLKISDHKNNSTAICQAMRQFVVDELNHHA